MRSEAIFVYVIFHEIDIPKTGGVNIEDLPPPPHLNKMYVSLPTIGQPTERFSAYKYLLPKLILDINYLIYII